MISRERPMLRAVDMVRVSRDQGDVVLIRDPLRISVGERGSPLVLTLRDAEIARRLDGTATLTDIAEALSVSSSDPVEEHEVLSLVESLSRRFLLEDDRFDEEHARQLDEFRGTPYRKAVGPGIDYTADNFDLRVQLGGIVANDWDMPGVQSLAGLIVPATDFRRAGRLYSRAYAAVRHLARNLDRVIVLGRSPAATGRLLVPLSKPFKTPMGVTNPDTEGLRALAIVPGRDELAHRDALVIERQVLFLRLLAPEVPVLPLLVGQLDGDDSDAATSSEVESATSALRRVLELPGRALVIAASDLAHVGAGHESTLDVSPETTRSLRERDAELGDLATKMLPAELWREAVSRRDRTHDHNLVAPLLLVKALAGRIANDEEPVRGSVLGYLAMTGETELVTSATIAFH